MTISTNKQTEQRDVFLSHRSIDDEFVRRLASDIGTKLYRQRNLTTWVDEAEIKAGQSIPGMVNTGLETSRFIALVLTPAYITSDSGWTDAEWHAALYTDPDNRSGRILPLLVENCEYVPVLLRHLRMIDLRGARYSQGLRELLAVLREESLNRAGVHRGQLITVSGHIDRGTLFAERSVIEAYPDVINERLYCNLLPIDKLPKYLYVAPIADTLLRDRHDGTFALPSKRELIAAVKSAQEGAERPFTPAFRIVEDNVITFHDLQDAESPLSPIVNVNDVVEIPLEDFIVDEDDRLIVTSLLNMALHRHANRTGLTGDDSKRDRFFFPPLDGSARVIQWKPWKKLASRTVAKPCLKDGKLLFWRHHAAYLKMLFLANHYYFQVIPTWVITEDGLKVRGGPDIGRWLIKWTGAERNLNILYHIRFWTTILKRNPGPLSIKAGDQWIEVSTVPAWVQQSYGIVDDQRNLLEALDNEASVIAEEEDAVVDDKLNEGLERLARELEEMEDSEEPLEEDASGDDSE